MKNKIVRSEWFSIAETTRRSSTLIDLRSEKEYEKGHIPSAINLPLLNNKERVTIGTTYKEKVRIKRFNMV